MLNLFDNYDDDYDGFGYGFSPYHHPYQRQRAMEIQRQRAVEAERRKRAAAAAAAEEERRRRFQYQQAMLERQRRAEEYERQRLEEEERRRQILRARAEAERRAKLERQMERQRQRRSEQPKTAVVRGPDGRLYRVYLEDDDELESSRPTQKQSMSIPIVTKEPSSMSYDGPMETESGATSTTNESLYHSAAEDENTVHMSNVTTPATHVKPKTSRRKSKSSKKKKGKKGKKKITITVEDASDSEYDDDFSSPWRNRRPGPGESWIEPVQKI